MEQEPEFGDPEAPATKADVRTAMRFMLGELRTLRTWAEGKFAAMDEKFKAIDQRFEALRQEVRALISEGLREMEGRMLRYFVGFFVAQVVAFYALLRVA